MEGGRGKWAKILIWMRVMLLLLLPSFFLPPPPLTHLTEETVL